MTGVLYKLGHACAHTRIGGRWPLLFLTKGEDSRYVKTNRGETELEVTKSYWVRLGR